MKKAIFILTLSLFSNTALLAVSQIGPFCFKGFYFGGNFGALTHQAHRTDLDDAFLLSRPYAFQTASTNVTAGMQMGYDWQSKYKIAGLVFDCNLCRSRVRTRPAIADSSTFREQQMHMNWIATIRAKLGASYCDTFAYITFGLAFSENDNRWRRRDLQPSDFHYHLKWGRSGWSGGCRLRMEGLGLLDARWGGLYINFTSRTATHVREGVRHRFNNEDQVWLMRILVNYRFGNLRSQ